MEQLTPAIIDGKEITTEGVIEVHSPFDGSLLGRVPECTHSEIDGAVEAAYRRLHDEPLPAHERAAILDRAASLLTERSQHFAKSISAEAAKPISAARTEVFRAIDTIRFSAAAARQLSGELLAMDAAKGGVGMLGFARRVPIGVVAGISPFNFPLNLVCHKLAPAVAAGCPIVLKPASATPLTAIAIAHLFADAGLPPGWINVVTCGGATAQYLVEHPNVAMITFTGSPEVGWGISATAPRKRVGLELGNNAPVIIEADADLDHAAARIVAGGLGYSGQTCISVQRVYAASAILDQLTDAVVEAVATAQVGDPADAETLVSSLITSSAAVRVGEWIDEAVALGAKNLTQAPLPSPCPQSLVMPAVLTGITPDMRVSRDEVFGPVIGIAGYDNFDDAIDLANDTRYGLQAGIFTTDLSKALAATERLRFGGITINEVPAFRVDQQPYGGIGESGNTREGPSYAVQEMTELRTVMIRPS